MPCQLGTVLASRIEGMQTRTRIRLIAVGGLLACALMLSAQGRGRGRGRGNDSEPAPEYTGRATSITTIFSTSDHDVLRQWVRTTPPKGLPPGLAKRGQLPPGLQKQLQKNGTLPPGLQKKISPFPSELNARLTPLPVGCGCDRVFLDGKALIVARVSHAILDIVSLF